MDFRWNDWNIEHIALHSIVPDEAERVVRHAKRPFPRRIDAEKWIVWGPGFGGRLLQEVFLREEDDGAFIIHARTLTEREKRRWRRRP